MPQHTIYIGGRSFDVVCQEGEEAYLESAAKILDNEAQKIAPSDNRITESQLLLMSGLLLADRIAAAEEKLAQVEQSGSEGAQELDAATSKLRQAEIEISAMQAEVAKLKAQSGEQEDKAKDAIEQERQARMHAEEVMEQMVLALEAKQGNA